MKYTRKAVHATKASLLMTSKPGKQKDNQEAGLRQADATISTNIGRSRSRSTTASNIQQSDLRLSSMEFKLGCVGGY
jgi:hypothetical protein